MNPPNSSTSRCYGRPSKRPAWSKPRLIVRVILPGHDRTWRRGRLGLIMPRKPALGDLGWNIKPHQPLGSVRDQQPPSRQTGNHGARLALLVASQLLGGAAGEFADKICLA